MKGDTLYIYFILLSSALVCIYILRKSAKAFLLYLLYLRLLRLCAESHMQPEDRRDLRSSFIVRTKAQHFLEITGSLSLLSFLSENNRNDDGNGL